MDADTFIKRWGSSTRNETAASKPHFIDLCQLLEVPLPTEDPDGSVYAFEKAVAKANESYASISQAWSSEPWTIDGGLLALNHERAAKQTISN